MKWEKVKERIAREVYTYIKNVGYVDSTLLACLLLTRDVTGEKLPFAERVQYFADKVFDTVMRWDIRSATKLKEVFPAYFPKSLRHGFLIEQTDNGWELIPYSSVK